MEINQLVHRIDSQCIEDGLELDCAHTGTITAIKGDLIEVETIGRSRRWWPRKYWKTDRPPKPKVIHC